MTAFTLADLPALFVHFLMLSMLAIGGAMSVAPEMHRYLVADQHWMTDTTFTTSVALAQAAPGPNLLFVPVLGYQLAGVLGAVVAMVGILLPSTALSLWVSRWGGRRREEPAVKAFTAGLAPITVGLTSAAAWVLAQPYIKAPGPRPGALLLIAVSALAMLRTRLSPVWLIIAGGVVGALGWA